MRLTLQNHIVCADYGQVHLDARVVGQIINYTAENLAAGQTEERAGM